MISFDFTVRLSDGIYEWLLNQDDPESFTSLFSNATPTYGHGIEYSFFFLLIASVLSAVAFYFVIANNIQAATKRNYVITWLMGYICLVVINFAGLAVLCPDGLDYIFHEQFFNMVRICFIDFFYYTIIFEIWSLLFKGASKAGDIHLLTVFK